MSDHANTYFARAMADGDATGGRFARQSATVVTGSGAKGSLVAPSWANDPVPDEQSLGEDVNAMEPVGTPAEIAASQGTEALAQPTEEAKP